MLYLKSMVYKTDATLCYADNIFFIDSMILSQKLLTFLELCGKI